MSSQPEPAVPSLADQLHLARFDLDAAKGDARAFLSGLLPYLFDAIDAVEIGAPHVGVRRIQAVVRMIRKRTEEA